TAAHGTDGAVETELAAEQAAVEDLLRELIVRGEHGGRDREIEVVAFLAQVGGSEIDDDGLRGQVETTVLDRGSHAFAALSHRDVGETDNLDLWQSVVDVNFDLDGSGFNAPWRGCSGSG